MCFHDIRSVVGNETLEDDMLLQRVRKSPL